MSTPNFQKDVIIPEIYDLENIKLIQSCAYPESPKNKVQLLKKKQIDQVIQGILRKPHTPQPHPPRSHTHSSAQTLSQPTALYSQVFDFITSGELTLEVDTEMGEIVANMEENYAPFRDRVKGVLERAHFHAQDQKLQQKQRQVDHFLKAICGQNKPVPLQPHRFAPVKGLIQDLEDIRKYGYPQQRRAQSAISRKDRVKTAQTTARLAQSRVITRNSNLKGRDGIELQKVKSKQLIERISSCLEEENKSKKMLKKDMADLAGQWGANGNLKRTFSTAKHMPIDHDTLSLLREKRLKSQALARIDNDLLKSTR